MPHNWHAAEFMSSVCFGGSLPRLSVRLLLLFVFVGIQLMSFLSFVSDNFIHNTPNGGNEAAVYLVPSTEELPADTLLRFEEASQDLPPFQPDNSIFVAVISGGSNETVKAGDYAAYNPEVVKMRARNRDALLETWANEQTYFVTNEDVRSDRIIEVNDPYEDGGRYTLPMKSKATWGTLWKLFGTRYDFYMKADDDTLVHMPQVQRILRFLDPTVPVILGHGVGKSRGFCHGGCGFMMSLGELELMGPSMDHCFGDSRKNWEDQWVKDCHTFRLGLGDATPLRCLSLNELGFGMAAFNEKNQTVVEATVNKLLSEDPTKVIMQATMHSVYADLQEKFFQLFRRLERDTSLVRRANAAILEHFAATRTSFTTSWRCARSATYAATTNMNSGLGSLKNDPPAANALCFASAIKLQLRLPSHAADPIAAILGLAGGLPEPIGADSSCSPVIRRAFSSLSTGPVTSASQTGGETYAMGGRGEGAASAQVLKFTSQNLLGQLEACLPDEGASWRAGLSSFLRSVSNGAQNSANSREQRTTNAHRDGAAVKGDTILVDFSIAEDVTKRTSFEARVSQLGMLLSTLRKTGSNAAVLVMVAKNELSTKRLRWAAAPCVAAGQCWIQPYDATQLGSIYHPQGVAYAAMSAVLKSKMKSVSNALVVPVQTLFQADPFEAVHLETDAVSLFLGHAQEEPVWLEQLQTSCGVSIPISDSKVDDDDASLQDDDPDASSEDAEEHEFPPRNTSLFGWRTSIHGQPSTIVDENGQQDTCGFSRDRYAFILPEVAFGPSYRMYRTLAHFASLFLRPADTAATTPVSSTTPSDQENVNGTADAQSQAEHDKLFFKRIVRNEGSCSRRLAVSAFVRSKLMAAESDRSVLYNNWDGPVVSLEDFVLASQHAGEIKLPGTSQGSFPVFRNLRGDPAPIVVNYANVIELRPRMDRSHAEKTLTLDSVGDDATFKNLMSAALPPAALLANGVKVSPWTSLKEKEVMHPHPRTEFTGAADKLQQQPKCMSGALEGLSDALSRTRTAIADSAYTGHVDVFADVRDGSGDVRANGMGVGNKFSLALRQERARQSHSIALLMSHNTNFLMFESVRRMLQQAAVRRGWRILPNRNAKEMELIDRFQLSMFKGRFAAAKRGQFNLVPQTFPIAGADGVSWSTIFEFFDWFLRPGYQVLLPMVNPRQEFLNRAVSYFKKIPQIDRRVMQYFRLKSSGWMARYMGITDEQSADDFINNVLSRVSIIFLMDRLEESLVVLRRHMKWDVADVLLLINPKYQEWLQEYGDLSGDRLASAKFEARYWAPVDRLELQLTTRQALDRHVRIEMSIYDKAVEKFEASKKAVYDDSFDEEVRLMGQVLKSFNLACTAGCNKLAVCKPHRTNKPLKYLDTCGFGEPIALDSSDPSYWFRQMPAKIAQPGDSSASDGHNDDDDDDDGDRDNDDNEEN